MKQYQQNIGIWPANSNAATLKISEREVFFTPALH